MPQKVSKHQTFALRTEIPENNKIKRPELSCSPPSRGQQETKPQWFSTPRAHRKVTKEYVHIAHTHKHCELTDNALSTKVEHCLS